MSVFKPGGTEPTEESLPQQDVLDLIKGKNQRVDL
jgi:hypothetical protein